MGFSAVRAGDNKRSTPRCGGSVVTALTAAGVRSLAVALLAIGCVAAIGVGSSVSAAVRLLTNAYVMGGTLTPTPDQAFIDMAVDDFINPTVNPKLLPMHGIPVTYPASAGIVPGSPTINESVRIGVSNLDAAIAAQQLATPGQPIVVFGYSQSTVVSMIEKANLEERKAKGEPVPNVTFVGIGVGNRPHGGIATYLQGVTIPIVDFSFNGPAPTDPTHGFTTVDIAREYDGLADFPQYPINLLADLNALLGVIFVHARYDQVSLDPNSPKYVPGTISQKYGDTTYYQIPTPNLPLFDLARIVGVPEKRIDVVEPFVKVLVDTGYDRTIPFGEPTTLGLIPRVDPGKLATDLVAAAGTGAANALRLFAPATPTPISHTADTAEATRSVAPSPVAASPEPSREKAASVVESTPSVDATKSVDVESNPSDVAADSLGAESTSDANTTESQDAAPTSGDTTAASIRKPKKPAHPERVRPKGHTTVRSDSIAADDGRNTQTPTPEPARHALAPAAGDSDPAGSAAAASKDSKDSPKSNDAAA